MSRGQFQSISRFGRSPLKRCKRGKSILVDVIDVDHWESSDELLIDVPGSSYGRSNGFESPKRIRKVHNRTHVSIVDEEDHGDLDSDASSSKKNHSNSNQPRTEEYDGEDCQILEEKCSNRRYPKRFGTSFKSGACRNRYGLFMDSESGSSDSESSDCEVMEGSSGKIREQWEKAAFRRHKIDDQTSASGPNRHSASSSSHKNISAQTSGVSLDSVISGQSSSRDKFEEKKDFNRNTANPFVKLDGANGRSETKYGNEQATFDAVQADIDQLLRRMFSCGTPSPENVFSSRFSCHDNKQNPPVKEAHLFHDNDESGAVRETQVSSEEGHYEENGIEEPVSSAQIDKGGMACDESQKEGMYYEMSTGKGGNNVPSQNKEEVVNLGKTRVNAENSCFEKEELFQEEQMIHQSNISNEKGKSNIQSDNLVEPKHRRTTTEQRDLSASEEPSLFQSETVVPNLRALKSRDKCFEEPLTGNENAGNVHNDLIGGREKLKETEEYRRAQEEEWASRQRQLQIQAVEVQRLRKRKQAETLRLLDVEKRQKQRVEEMRETQKKDEETINLKEQLRVKIRKELEILEVKYRDTASLLRALGISVGGGPYPSPSEVNAAFKKALLKFHPDRTSSSNIQLQVEAEEKFKLITRLREKLRPTA